MEILEYCDRLNVIEREQYYLDTLKPEYNILKTAGSSLGFYLSEESKAKISSSKKGILREKFTEEHKTALSNALKGKNKGENSPLSRKVLVTNVLTNESNIYPSMRTAALSLNIGYAVVTNFIRRNQLKPYKGKYIFQVI